MVFALLFRASYVVGSGAATTRESHCALALLQGELFKYGVGSSQVAFQTGDHPRHLVLIGGLSDGLLFAPYSQLLSDAVDGLGWSLVQVQLSSSCTGYGIATLDRDADELLLLTSYLQQQCGSSGVALMGHSTGGRGV